MLKRTKRTSKQVLYEENYFVYFWKNERRKEDIVTLLLRPLSWSDPHPCKI